MPSVQSAEARGGCPNDMEGIEAQGDGDLEPDVINGENPVMGTVHGQSYSHLPDPPSTLDCKTVQSITFLGG